MDFAPIADGDRTHDRKDLALATTEPDVIANDTERPNHLLVEMASVNE